MLVFVLVFRMSGWHSMAIGMPGRAMRVVILYVDYPLLAMFVTVGGNGNAYRRAYGATGNGAFTPADLGAHGGTQSAAYGAAQHCIAVHCQSRGGG